MSVSSPAPRTLASTGSAIWRMVRPVTSAWICDQRSEFAPPPTKARESKRLLHELLDGAEQPGRIQRHAFEDRPHHVGAGGRQRHVVEAAADGVVVDRGALAVQPWGEEDSP